MKVTLKDKEIMSYVLSVNVEVEGEEYSADISYRCYEGYEVTFFDKEGKRIGYPEWARKYEENNLTGTIDSLGYWLESEIGGWFQWEPSKEGVSA